MGTIYRYLCLLALLALCGIATGIATGCANQSNGKLTQIGQEAGKALEKTGQVFEGAAKGAIEAVEK